ncbi:hypothetical protein [Sphingomonas sp.]|uniref:hypothetical protein n=1 Tax=Sphingomonas sp. TaxID=28214 RepID=UPI0025E0B1F3|nr:hypothetical protein [Sphingomonas sp.]
MPDPVANAVLPIAMPGIAAVPTIGLPFGIPISGIAAPDAGEGGMAMSGIAGAGARGTAAGAGISILGMAGGAGISIPAIGSARFAGTEVLRTGARRTAGFTSRFDTGLALGAGLAGIVIPGIDCASAGAGANATPSINNARIISPPSMPPSRPS